MALGPPYTLAGYRTSRGLLIGKLLRLCLGTAAILFAFIIAVGGCSDDDVERFTGRLPTSFPTSVPFPEDSKILESEVRPEDGMIRYIVDAEIGSTAVETRQFFEDELLAQGWRICASLESNKSLLVLFSEMACIDPPNSVTIESIDEVRSLATVELAIGE